jgi:hypothetical protein
MSSHVLIPDTQVKAGVKTDHIHWAAQFIKEVKPDQVIIIGDWWDMPSLSSWSKKREAEGQRYKKDIDAGMEAMELFMKGAPKNTSYHFCEGNHENRIDRYLDDFPHMEGHMSLGDCDVESFGIKRHKFLKPVKLDGVKYAHYFYNANSGRPFASARLMIKATHESCTAGHLQTKDDFMDHMPDSDRYVRGLIAGAFYQHDEEYKGPQGNNHWRGIIHKTNVRRGMYDLKEVSLHTLRKSAG